MKNLIIVLVLILFFDQLSLADNLTSNVSAQGKLGLNYCFKVADDFNKEILIAATNLSLAKAKKISASAIPNPMFNLLYGWGPAWQYIVAGNNQQFGWTEEIQVLGKRTKKINVARANYLQILFQVEATRFKIHNLIRRAYIALAQNKVILNALINQVQISKKLYSIAELRYNEGKIAKGDLKQAELTILQVELLLSKAKAKVIDSSNDLAQLLGRLKEDDSVIDIDENVLFNLNGGYNSLEPNIHKELPPLEKLLPAGFSNRKDLATLIQQTYTDKYNLILAKTQRLPDPFIGFNYMFTTYKTYQPQYFLPNARVPQQPGYLLSYSQELPIFYNYQGQIDNAKQTLNQDYKQNEAQMCQIALDIIIAYESIKSLRKNLAEYQNKLLPESLKIANLSQKSYSLGKIDQTTALLARQQYMQMLFSYFDTLVKYHNSWADFENAVGLPLQSN